MLPGVLSPSVSADERLSVAEKRTEATKRVDRNSSNSATSSSSSSSSSSSAASTSSSSSSSSSSTSSTSCNRAIRTPFHTQLVPMKKMQEKSALLMPDESAMTMDVKPETKNANNSPAGVGSGAGPQHECAGCKKRIGDRYMLKALDLFWHEDCLKCACCDCRLGEVGSTLFTKANLILCKRDYLRLFGTTGYCSACSKMIPAFEMVMRARGNVYHLECFACQQCNHRFCVGDRFYLCENKILCEYDYEERMVFANMPYNYNSIAHIKRQTQNLPPVVNDDGSSGYGSPDSLTFDGK